MILKNNSYKKELYGACPEQGEIINGVEYGGPPWGPYLLWKKGRDLWDMGLVDFYSERAIYQS